jgi:CSLREA domain-containing protein
MLTALTPHSAHHRRTRRLPTTPWQCAAALLFALLAAATSSPPIARAETLVVTNTQDSGPGSLRDALFAALLSGAPENTIRFQFQPPGHREISLTSGPLSILSNVTIEAPPEGVTVNAQNASAAILTTGGTIIIKNMTLVNGSESAVGNFTDLWLENVTIADSHGEKGGGIANYRKLRAVNSTIYGNKADAMGGGIFNADGAELVIANVTLSDNEAPSGGAIRNDGTLSSMNSTIADNRAAQGGGLANLSGTMSIRNTLMVRNGSGGNCVGIVAVLELSANNMQDEGPPCGVSFRVNPSAASQLGPLDANGGPTATHALLPGSPAVNAGNIDDCLGMDQRGRDRPATVQDPCDVGAYELDPAAIAAVQPLAPLPAPLSESPFAQRPPLQPVYIVTSLEDARAADLQCVSTLGACTLRAAVQTANRRGIGTIQLSQVGTYTLSISGRSLGDQGGDLDISGLVHIQNTSRGQVTIQQTVDRSVFSVRAGGHLYLSDVQVSGGNATDGGGLRIDEGGTAVVEGVTFSHNQASDRGGAIYANGPLRMFNSTITANGAGAKGGGVYADVAGDIVIQSSTITLNNAPSGAGVDFAGNNADWQIDNTIIAEQAAGLNCRAPIARKGSGGNLQSTESSDCGEGFARGDAALRVLSIDADPTPTHPLGELSAAIGKGRPDVCASRSGADQRWIKRPSACDIGARESER